MKALRIVLIALGLILVAVLGWTSQLPTDVNVSKSIQIDAPIQRVFNIVNSFEEYNDWSPWYELDPHAIYTLLGRQTGVGARYEWKSTRPELGSGSQEIVDSQPYHQVTVELEFGVQGTGLSTYVLKAEEGITEVSWDYYSKLGNGFISRIQAYTLQKKIAADCERGLERLKQLAEASVQDSDGRSLEAKRSRATGNFG